MGQPVASVSQPVYFQPRAESGTAAAEKVVGPVIHDIITKQMRKPKCVS